MDCFRTCDKERMEEGSRFRKCSVPRVSSSNHHGQWSKVEMRKRWHMSWLQWRILLYDRYIVLILSYIAGYDSMMYVSATLCSVGATFAQKIASERRRKQAKHSSVRKPKERVTKMLQRTWFGHLSCKKCKQANPHNMSNRDCCSVIGSFRSKIEVGIAPEKLKRVAPLKMSKMVIAHVKWEVIVVAQVIKTWSTPPTSERAYQQKNRGKVMSIIKERRSDIGSSFVVDDK